VKLRGGGGKCLKKKRGFIALLVPTPSKAGKDKKNSTGDQARLDQPQKRFLNWDLGHREMAQYVFSTWEGGVSKGKKLFPLKGWSLSAQ